MTLSENAKIWRKKHARQNWKNKVERRKLEAKGQTTANVEEMVQMVPNVHEGARASEQGPDDVDFSTVKIRREKVEYSREEEEKLKRLREESKEKPGSHPSNEVIVEENQRTVTEFCKNKNSNLVLENQRTVAEFCKNRNSNLVLPADEWFAKYDAKYG